MWQKMADAPVDSTFSASVGPEKIVYTGGLCPGLFRSNKGSLFVNTSDTAGFPINVISRDAGKTWQCWIPKGSPPDSRPAVPSGCVGQRRDGVILALEHQAYGPNQFGDFMCRMWMSDDDMATFTSKMVKIHHPRGRAGVGDDGKACGLVFCRSMLELPSGSLLATGYGWVEGDIVADGTQPEICTRSRVMLFRSDNGGDSWRYVSDIASDPTRGPEGFNETAMVRLSRGPLEGRLVAIMRTGSANWALHQAFSDDEGATWSAPRALPFAGVYPDLIELADGTLACSFGWRGGGALESNYVVFSRDGGESWCNLTPLPLSDAPATWYRASTCYTGLREITPGRLLVVYNHGEFGANWPVKYIASREVLLVAP